MAFCGQCGAELNPTARFCGSCGAGRDGVRRKRETPRDGHTVAAIALLFGGPLLAMVAADGLTTTFEGYAVAYVLMEVAFVLVGLGARLALSETE